MIKRIGDRLSNFIDRLDAFLDAEADFFLGLIPYKGRRYKK